MRVYYITRDMSGYRGANYQNDFLQALMRHSFVSVQYYSVENNVISLLDLDENDWLFLGHTCLRDKDGSIPIEDCTINGLKSYKKTAIFLNKEYVNLNEKIDFIRSNNISIIFTHSYKFKRDFSSVFKNIILIPFAASDQFFDFRKRPGLKTIDIAFSGIMKNRNRNVDQTDLRLLIQKEIFWCVGDFRIMKKWKYRGLNVVWNGFTGHRVPDLFLRFVKLYKRMSLSEYEMFVRTSKVVVCTLSPFELIGPRFYECLASNSILLSEKRRCVEKLVDTDRVIFVDEFNSIFSAIDAAVIKSRALDCNPLKASEQLKLSWTSRVDSCVRALEQFR